MSLISGGKVTGSDLVLEITRIQKVIKVLRLDQESKVKLYHERSSGPKKEFRNSSFRGETSKGKFMKEIKNEWAEAKAESQERMQQSQMHQLDLERYSLKVP